MNYPILDEECKQQFQLEKELPYNLFEYDFYKEKYLNPFEKSPLTKYSYKNFKGNNLQYPIESNLDKEIIKLGKIFKTKDFAQRETIRNSFDRKDVSLLLSFLERASVFVLRGKEEYLEAAMLTMAMIDFSKGGDPRDICISYSFVEYVINNSTNKNTLFQQAIRLANTTTADFLHSVQNRETTLEVDFGYTTYKFKDGLGFIACRCCGFFDKDAYSTNKDLVQISTKIRSYLQKNDIKSFATIDLSTKSPFLVPAGSKEYSSVINGKANISLSYVVKDRIIYNLSFQITEFKTNETANAFLQLISHKANDEFGEFVFDKIENIVYSIYGKSISENENNIYYYPKLHQLKKTFEEIIRLG